MSAPDNDENLERWKATGYIIATIVVMIFLFGLFATLLEHVGLWSFRNGE